MSVIHEAIKRARAVRQEKKQSSGAPASEPPQVVVQGGGTVPAWLLWMMLLFVLAEGALYLRERGERIHSEDKMRKAYLELNDERGKLLDKNASHKRVMTDLQEMESKYNAALRSREEAFKAKENVEFDNLTNQKKVNDLTREKHELEMDKYKLQAEKDSLKAQLARAEAAAVPPDPSN